MSLKSAVLIGVASMKPSSGLSGPAVSLKPKPDQKCSWNRTDAVFAAVRVLGGLAGQPGRPLVWAREASQREASAAGGPAWRPREVWRRTFGQVPPRNGLEPPRSLKSARWRLPETALLRGAQMGSGGLHACRMRQHLSRCWGSCAAPVAPARSQPH